MINNNNIILDSERRVNLYLKLINICTNSFREIKEIILKPLPNKEYLGEIVSSKNYSERQKIGECGSELLNKFKFFIRKVNTKEDNSDKKIRKCSNEEINLGDDENEDYYNDEIKSQDEKLNIKGIPFNLTTVTQRCSNNIKSN